MNVVITEDFEEAGRYVAAQFMQLIRQKPIAKLGLATGGSVEGVYASLVAACQKREIDFSEVSTVNLDEYIGLGETDEQSYRYYMNHKLFDHININKADTYVPDGTAPVSEELAVFREKLHGSGLPCERVDLQLLGVGVTGHIGFNEPAAQLTADAHVEQLSQSTIEANSRYFCSLNEVPTQALTQGMGDILKAKSLILIAGGPSKAEPISRLLNDENISTFCPVTFLKLHPQVTVVIDRQLANEVGI